MIIWQHVLDLALVAGLALMCLGVGQLLIVNSHSTLRVISSPLDRLVYQATLGTGVVGSWILFGIWLLGVSAVSLSILLAPFGILAAARMPRLLRDLRLALSQLFNQAGPSTMAVLGLLIAFLLVQALAPPTDWDSLVYHLEIPRQWLEEGRIHVPEDNFHVAYVGLLHMLYLPLLAIGSSSGPSILNALSAILLGCAVFSFCLRFFSHTTARLSLLTLWGTTSLVLVAVTPRLDTTLTLFLFLTHYALLIGSTDDSARKMLLLAGVLLGFAAGIKFHALAYAAALAPLIFLVVYMKEKSAKSSLRALGLFAVPFLLGAMPWIAKNQLLLDAPFYPHLAERNLQPWLAELADGAAIPPNVNPQVFRAYGQAREEFNLIDFFTAPGRLTVEPEGPLYFTSPIALLSLLSVFFLREKILILLLGPAILYMILVVVPFSSTNIRYLLPSIPALTIVGAEISNRITSRFSAAPLRKGVLGLVAALGVAPVVLVTTILISELRTVDYALGKVSRDEYLASYPIAGFSSYWSQVQFANKNKDAGTRTLMLFEARGYYFDVPVLQDNVMTNWPLLVATGATEECLEGTNIEKLIVASGAIGYFEERGMDTSLLRWDLFPAFAERCLTVTHETPGIVAYRVRIPNPPSPAHSP